MHSNTWLLLLGLALAACDGSNDDATLAVMDADVPDAEPPAVRMPELDFPSGVLADENPEDGVVEVHLTAGRASIDLGDGVMREMYAYNGHVPGPALHAKAGDRVVVHFRNELAEPTTVHWHGLRIPASMDGSPRIQDPVEPGEEFTYEFVVPDAGTFWYHPHVRANEQVEKGLYGPIVVRDRNDPEYDVERVMMLDDILLGEDAMTFPPFLASHPELMHGRYGNVLLTNARESDRVLAYGDAYTIERWRIVNTANARTMELSIHGARFRVIGTDGGLLAEPYETERLLVPVGQRYDLEVTFDAVGIVQLLSHVATLDENDEVVEVATPVYDIDVVAADRELRAIEWPTLPTREPREPSREVMLDLEAVTGGEHGIMWTINGMSHPEEPIFTFDPGETVRIRIVNKNGPEHPFHLHGQFFEIVDQGNAWTSQPGLKDTVLVPGLETVEIIAYLDNPGRWMAHCHILEHAELGMMAEILVGEDETPAPPDVHGHH